MMMLRIPELILAVLVAAAFAAGGDALLGRCSRGWGEWNASFLVGLGVSAALLYPLSAVLPGRALEAIFLGLIACSAWRWLRIGGRRRLREESTPHDGFRAHGRAGVLDGLFGLTIAACVLGFVVLNWRVGYRWDGFHIWATKALVLFDRGDTNMDPSHYAVEILNRTVTYPFAVPLFEALVSVLRGSFDFDALKPLFLIFDVSLLIGTYGLARRFASRTASLGAVAILALLPAVSTDWNIGGYADLPLAAFVAACAAELAGTPEGVFGFRSAGPWLLGSLCMVKSEGSIYLAVGCAVLAAAAIRRRPGLRNIAREISVAVPVAAIALCRTSYVFRLRVPDDLWRPIGDLRAGPLLAAVAEVSRECVHWLLSFRWWGLFWPAFVLAALVVFKKGPGAARAVAAAALLAVAAVSAVFLFTEYSIPVHVEQAYRRLLEHVAPLAAATLAAAFTALRRRSTRPDDPVG